MSFLDKAKDLAGEHGDKIGEGLDKAADLINEKTGGKFEGQIDAGVEKAKDLLGDGNAPEASAGPQA